MKIKPRKTITRIVSQRITAPEYKIDRRTDKKILQLSYANLNSDQCHNRTTKGIFLYAAGTNEEGELPDGLDRLFDHQFNVHLDGDNVETAKAIGLDIMPSRVLSHQMVVLAHKDIKVVTVTWLLDGAVCRITSTPPNTSANVLQLLLKELDVAISNDTEFLVGTKVGDIGTVTAVNPDTLDIKLKAGVRAKSVKSSSVDVQAVADEMEED